MRVLLIGLRPRTPPPPVVCGGAGDRGARSVAPSPRSRTMLYLSLLLVILTHPTRTAYVTTPSFAARLDKFYEKLERLTVAPTTEGRTEPEQWVMKLEKLNALSPENLYLSDYDEELLSAMQTWAGLNAQQLDGVAKELQRVREDKDEGGVQDRIADPYYAEMDENDEEYIEADYHNDGKEDEEEEDVESSSPRPAPLVTPSAYTKEDPEDRSILDPIAATNERPRILDDSALTPLDRFAIRRAAFANMARVVQAKKCLTPQPRWLTVKQLAPAADTVYMPPCVELHRCAPDSGCCDIEAEICAPSEGNYVAIPFYMQKANGNMSVVRMLFYNHTRCACVSRDTVQMALRAEPPAHDRQNDWRPSPPLPSKPSNDDTTAPPQLRRCTCPTLFLGTIIESGACVCACEWREISRRRECLSLSRGREHFGLRDRVCVSNGACALPTCEYGAYDAALGRCPARKVRRVRYHARSRFHHLHDKQ